MGRRPRFAAGLALILAAACAPAAVGTRNLDRNPVEIIDESPRVYHIKFEDFADSLETIRARNYMRAAMPFGLYMDEDAGGREYSRADSAIIEYRKAAKRFRAGAGAAAMAHVRRAIELNPAFLPSYVVFARILLADGRVLRAQAVLEQVLSRDPANSEALTVLAKCHEYMGRLDAAREALVDAVIFDRINLEAWGELERLGLALEFDVATRDAPELAFVEKRWGRNLDIVIDSSLIDCPAEASAWMVFASQRAVWRYEGKYRQRYGAQPYERTYDEDIDCYMSLAVAWKVLTARPDSTAAGPDACDDDYLDFLARVSDGGHLVSHVLMDYICLNAPGTARRFPPEIIERMRDYVDKYVLIPRQEGS